MIGPDARDEGVEQDARHVEFAARPEETGHVPEPAAHVPGNARARIREIAGTELPGWREAGAALIDVREPAEYATGHIEQANEQAAIDLTYSALVDNGHDLTAAVAAIKNRWP